MEKASAAALRKEMDLHRALKLFHNALNLAIREAVPTARRFTCKARRAMRIKCKKRQQLAKLKEELDELASDVDEEEVEKKAEQLAELGRFCGELPACDSKAAELVFARIRDVFGKDDRGQMAALRKPGGCDERPLFAETAVTKAEVLADIYAEVGEGTTAAAEEPSVGEELLETDAEISVAEVREALRAQPDGKAAGLDGVNCEPLKHLGDNGVLLLHRIFCLVYENGEWPRGWAMACIVPILKMGKDPSLGGSYRPVSLTSVLAKLCERVIGGRLKHVTQRCISDSQAGFRRGRGTAEHLAACQLRLAAHTARGRFSAMLCADLSRAFDRVDHNLLLGRLGDLGVRGRLWRVLRAFLHKRMARVRVDGEFSETRAMKAGVPQGTILAPMLFVLFVRGFGPRKCLHRSGWIDTCENLLIRPGAADPMSPGEVACLESEAIARADAEVLEEATRGALAAQLCRGVLAVRDRERAAGVRRRVAVLPSPPETRNTLRRSAGPSQQETRAEFEKRRDALRESNMAATAVLQRRLDEKRAWLRKRSKELVEARGVGADRVEIEWEQGVYDLYMEYKAEMPCESTQDFYPE